MNSQKGITLTSLVIYITIVLIVVGILAVITANLQGNIKEIYAEGTNNAEIDKFNMYFLKEVKKQGNAIDEDKPVSSMEVYFTTGNKYTYNSNDRCIYLNDTIKVAENIEICEFDRDLVNEKTIIIVEIKAINGEEKRIEYVLSSETIADNYEDESEYIDKIIIYNIPDEYQQVQYIESTGTQWINTGFIANQDTRVVIDFQYMNINAAFAFGSRLSVGVESYTLNIGSVDWALSSYGNKQEAYIKADTNRHIVDKNKNLLYLDGILKYTFEEATFTTPAPLELFASYNNGVEGYLPSSVRLYSLNIYDNDVLVREFIPCYRKTDNVVGLYDLVNNVFYTNSATGDDFIAGIEI